MNLAELSRKFLTPPENLAKIEFMSNLLFADESPKCSVCGCPCDDGYVMNQGSAVCAACDEDEGAYEAADMAYDLQGEEF